MSFFNNMFKFGVDDFDLLDEEATAVGSEALPVTCVRIDPRKSIVDGTDVPAGTPDLRWVVGEPVVSSLRGDENRLDSDLTNWTEGPSTPPVIDNGDGSYRVQLPDGSGTLIGYPVNFAADDYTLSIRVRCAPGEACPGDMKIFSRKVGVASKTYYDGPIPSSWETLHFTVAEDNASDELLITDLFGSGGIDIELRDVRIVQSSAPAAGLPDGSPAGTDYLKDVLTFLHTYTASASMQFTVTTYGWSDSDNPAAAECVLFESGAFRLKLSAAGFVEIDGTAVSTKKLTANTLSVITVKYDGVNHTLQVDGETPVVVASAIIPSGTSYVGNTAAGDKPSHALHHIDIFDDKLLTAAEITTREDGYQVRLGGIVLF